MLVIYLTCATKNQSAFTRINQAKVSSVVQEHQQQLAKLEPVVQQVNLRHDRAIAHLDRKHINNPAAIANMQPIDMGDVGEG